MLLNDTLSHEHLNYSSFMNNDIPSPSFFISKTDHNINMFLKKKVLFVQYLWRIKQANAPIVNNDAIGAFACK